MIDTLKKMILPAIVAVVVTFIVLVGSNQPAKLGSEIETFPAWFVKGLYGGASKVQVVDSSGNVVAPIVSSTISGTTATLSGIVSTATKGSKLGTKNTYNPIYVGAGDGCTALLYAASTTLVSSATSTSFCN